MDSAKHRKFNLETCTATEATIPVGLK